jgi:cell division septum initiation protein DivIVA
MMAETLAEKDKVKLFIDLLIDALKIVTNWQEIEKLKAEIAQLKEKLPGNDGSKKSQKQKLVGAKYPKPKFY